MPTTAARVRHCQECGCETTSTHTTRGYTVCSNCYNSRTFVCPECRQRWFNYDQVDGMCYLCYDRLARWDAKEQPRDGKVDELRSSRQFGIELETAECDGYRRLRDKTIYGVKHDGSISGMEFVSPILQGDKGLWATRGFCTRAKHMGFEVDDDCGYHLHFDVSNNTPIQQRHIAYAYATTYPFWRQLVNHYRAYDCRWCGSLSWEPQTMVTTYNFPRFCNNQNRYTWFNVNSLERHGTFEIRLHEGTLDSRAICNWVKAHLRFADFVQDMKFAQIRDMFNVSDKLMWRAVTNTWADPALRRYYRRIMRRNSLDSQRSRGRV